MSFRRLVVVTAFLLWMLVVVSAYFVVHKPWPPYQTYSPLGALVDVALALALVSLAGGLGRRIFGPLCAASSLERLALHTATGLGMLGLGVLAVGLAGLLRSWLAWLALVIGLFGLRGEIGGWLAEWRSLGETYRESGLLGRLVSGLTLVLIGLALFQALAPPIKWDALVYHLELPRQYLAAGRIAHLYDNLFLGLPQLAEVLYTWAIGLRADTTAAVLGWAVGVVMLVGVSGFAGRLLGPRAAVLAPAILLSGATIARSLAWSYADVWAMLFGLGTIIALNSYAQTGARVWLVCVGIMTGFAIGTKYTAGVLLMAGAAGVLWSIHSRGRRVRYLALLSATTLVVAAPWLLKNLAFTGNPVYPFFFPGGEMDALRQAFYSGPAPSRTLLDDLILPWQATILGIEGGPGSNASIGPLLLALIPGALISWQEFSRDQRGGLIQLLIVAGTGWLIWAGAAHLSDTLAQPRLYFAIFPALATLAAAGFEAASRLQLPGVRVGRVLAALVALALSLVAVNESLHFLSVDPLPVLAGAQSRQAYLVDRLGWYALAIQRTSDLPPGSKVVLLWEPRGYYCRVDCQPDVILDRWWHLRRTRGNAAAIADGWRAQGVTHVLLYDLGVRLEVESQSLFEPSDWAELERLKQTELRLLQDFDGVYSLYAVASR